MRVVGEAADGNEAIVEAIRLQPDVILLDLAMPNRSGLEALPELRRVAPNAQIVVFSGFASEPSPTRCSSSVRRAISKRAPTPTRSSRRSY